jgi:micrococcal nuclease
MTPFRGKLLAGAAVVFAAALSLGLWLGGREGPPGAEAKPAEPLATLAHAGQQSESSRSSRSSSRSVPSAADETGHMVAVARIVDGDTLDLADGRRVRLLQIDTPELRGSECYADEASAQLATLLPTGTEVRIETDPNLDKVDRYGRALGYVLKGTENVNVTLVREGAASVWFYGGTRGKYASELEAAASEAYANGRGLWGACAGTVYDPSRAVATRSGSGPPPAPAPAVPTPAADAGASGICDSNYAGVCVPLYEQAGDLDCADIGSSVTVVGSDPHGFDGNDNDGLGCENYGRREAAAVPSPVAGAAIGSCDPNYEGACVPLYEHAGDLDCADIGSSVTVVGSDPHGFDGNDNDGLGCESYG